MSSCQLSDSVITHSLLSKQILYYVCRSSDRPLGPGSGPKQHHQQLDLPSAHKLPDHKHVAWERPDTSGQKQQHASDFASDSVAAQFQLPALKQAQKSEQRRLTGSDATANAQPLQALTTDGCDSARATEAEHEPVPAQHMVKQVSVAAGQLAQPDTQTGRHKSPPARIPRSSADDPGRSQRLGSPSRKAPHMTPASSQESPSSQQRSVTPSGSRQAMEHHRRRRHFHDEPVYSIQPSSDRKRSHTPELEPGTDVKRVRRDSWQPASRSVRYAEHHRPPQADFRHDAHHKLSSLSAKQEADMLEASRHHSLRDSSRQSMSRSSRPDYRHADAPFTGQRAHSDRSISTSPPYSCDSKQYAEHLPFDRAEGSQAASHARSWNSRECTVWVNARTSAKQTSGFNRQQNQPSWSHADRSRPSALRGQQQAHDGELTDFSPLHRMPAVPDWQQHADIPSARQFADFGELTKNRKQIRVSNSQFAIAANFRAQQLESEMDSMLAGLLSAYKQPMEAMGAKQVLQQMSNSLKLTEYFDESDGQLAFITTRQVSWLQCWLHLQLWWCKSRAALAVPKSSHVLPVSGCIASRTAQVTLSSCIHQSPLQAAAACPTV